MIHPATLISKHSVLALAVGLLAFLALWFGTLDYRDLIKTDEGRYAEIAREMLVSGDWITPRQTGVKYFYKPPLQYWTTALAFKAFGVNEWTARLWPALTGFAGVLLAMFTLGRLFDRRTAWLGGAVCASSLLYYVTAHFNVLDMGLSFFMFASLCAFMLAHYQLNANEQSRRRWMLVCWAAMALAVLSKGLVGLVLPGTVLLVAMLVERDFSILRRLEWLRGLALFFLIAAPWFVAVSLHNPEFPRYFFYHEHLERFLTTVHRRYQPWWYFLPILGFGLLPWIGWLPQALLRAGLAHRDPGFSPEQGRVVRLALIWCVLIFVFFSVSKSKLPSYILPIFPALALLIAVALRSTSSRAWQWHSLALALVGLLGTILVWGMQQQAGTTAELALYENYRQVLLAALAFWLLGCVGAFVLARWRRNAWAAGALATTALLSFTLGMLGHQHMSVLYSARTLSATLKPLLAIDSTVYSVGFYDHTLPYYLERTVTLVAHQDEMSFGLQQEPQLWIPKLEAFGAQWAKDSRPYAVLPPDALPRLQALNLPLREIYRDPRRVVITRP
jgi:4-amino-4-deoxy-L-arabinose transferase-like glycosyltransferase